MTATENIETVPIENNRKFKLPVVLVRSGINAYEKANFLCDDGGYLCGLDLKKFESAKKLHLELLANCNSPEAKAIKAYFSKGVQQFEDANAGKTYMFMVNGKFINYEIPELRQAWNDRPIESTDNTRCLVTGRLEPPEAIHGKIKLAGGQAGGSNLVSLNAESFLSYGEEKNKINNIGKYASFAYVTALNNLLMDDKHRKRIAQDTLVYWAEGNDTAETETFNLFVEPQESDTSKLDAIMKAFTAGNKVNAEGCDMNKHFYLLCLSPNAGRISIRFFHCDSFGSIIRNNAEHYKNLEIVGDSKYPYIPPWVILRETTVKKTAAGAAPLLGGQLMSSVITGGKYPMTLFNAILTRIRAGEEINRTKAAVIKAVLIRNFISEVATVALNNESLNIPYTLGRLFYILEYLQEQANNGNATIRQRYFSSACTNPRNVFPKLLSLSMHHADKLENAAWFEKQKGELISRLDSTDPFPSALNLQQQGEFIVGYYHQQQSRYTKKEDK